ncbi:MAG: ankyrin repeat domain-containing protein [Clostridia bacterium]|nr:ankyrin repeat domain-containing protein [Clostridia bacterium]
MAKKRKTLPKDFKAIVESGDFEAFKKVFDVCEINAYYNDLYKRTALFFNEATEEMLLWLLENGANVNQKIEYGITPLHDAAGRFNGKLQFFIDHGSDVMAESNNRLTPLHYAADPCPKLDNIKILLQNGADINAKGGYNGATPLDYMLMRCENYHINFVADAAEFLIDAGAIISDLSKKCVKRIGENFEFIRDRYDPDGIEEADRGLGKLYKLFGVPAVPKRVVNDGKTLIEVKSSGWRAQYKELWQMLVPGSGKAKLLQGEVIRITGKISHEILDNGGANWCGDFRKMLDALSVYLRRNNSLNDEDLNEADKLIKAIDAYSENEELDRLCELSVKWIIQNPEPILFDGQEVKYKR